MKPEPSPLLASLLAKLVDRSLDETGNSRLEEILSKNPAAREYYRFYLATHLELTEVAPQFISATPPHPSWLRRNRVPLAIAALIPLMFALTLWAPWRHTRKTSTGPVLAVIKVAEDARWSLPKPPAAELDLHPGRIQLTAGTLALALNGSQMLTLLAPSDFELIDESEVFLYHGNASLRIDEGGSTYTIRVPRGMVVDLGTEFSVKVAADGTADVWVFEGKALASLTAGASGKKQQALTAGQSLRIGETLTPSPAKAVDFIRPLRPESGTAGTSGVVIADFSSEFPTSTLGSGQPFGGTETPATGWSYLWNPTGILGASIDYRTLATNTVNTFPAADGGGIFPMFTNLGNVAFNASGQGHFKYGRIAITSIHPGRYVSGKDYRAVIAYTIQPDESGRISIANSSLAKHRIDGSPTNGVDLDIYVNDTWVGTLSKNSFQSLSATDFNGKLGTLSPGDTVYVTLGNNGDEDQGDSEIYDAYDACVIDFQLVKEP